MNLNANNRQPQPDNRVRAEGFARGQPVNRGHPPRHQPDSEDDSEDDGDRGYGLKMTSVQLVLILGGKWKSHHGQYWYEGQRAKVFDFPRDANYDQLLDKNVDPLVCISVEDINHVCPERNHKQPESSHNPHHTTLEYEFHHTHQSNIQVSNMDGFQRSDVPNMGANLDDIREGLTPTPNIDTASPSLIPDHDEVESHFNPIPNQTPNQYDKQFAHVQRLVLPPCASYSINSGKVALRPVTMRIERGEVFPSKKQLQLHLEARFPHQRQASARVIEENIKDKFHDHPLYKPKEIVHDMQREFGISCNYHKGYQATHIALEETQGTPAESYSPHRGVLFVAVCMDDNEQIFPLAFGVGESETNEEGWFQGWFYERRTSALKLTTQLTTAADVAIGVKDEQARYMRVYPITFYTFLVKDGDLDGHMGLTTKTCTCREFDVDQLPCAHALACISAFLVAAYNGEIHPVGQPSEWLVPLNIESKIVRPPVGHRPLGRPRKNRILSFCEEVTQRRCTTCHRVGHNSHMCTYPKSSTPSNGIGSTREIGEASGSHNVL
ncbi:hypothetical protein Ddye_005152 [Dipteronia dyeriana]|uniref:SWIM-type domain-containing protein n=1 Tax=Dipteronia dyeriana TaxID=168575 RepID=A0AAD9XFR5_9ROSI|nr:hypothetical protein Ddye_005152 [Dipteronia dyeriana]